MYNRRKQLAPALIVIQAGAFVTGSTLAQAEAAAAEFGLPAGALLDETPQQRTELATFAISAAPITCDAYAAFVIATDHPTPTYWRGDDPPSALLDHPVVGVSWNDARAFCRWLTAATGRAFRLPSEMEWERAARGDDGGAFPWGDEWEPGGCNVAGEGPGRTTSVGSFPLDTSPFGCVDTAGNVAEWTGSRYRPYPGGTIRVEQGRVVVRGGGWQSPRDAARCARRTPADPAASGPALGFRVVSDEIL
jgi:formylglycine-generating enzyme required for sulfatase activity